MSERVRQTRLARERNHYWWRLVLDGRQRTPPTGEWTIDGPLPPECYEELMALWKRWEAEGKI
jgi:hypothetical protein